MKRTKMLNKTGGARRFFALAVMFAVLACRPAQAQTTLRWDAGGTGSGPSDGAGNWDSGATWWNGSTDVSWTYGSGVVFGNGGAGDAVALVVGPTTVNSLTMNSFSGTYTLGTYGQTITLNHGITNNASAGVTTIISPLTLGAAQTWLNNSINLLTVSDVDNGGYLLTVGGDGNTVLSGSLYDTGGLAMNGTGTLTLAGANSYSGDTTVNAGTLVADGSSAVAGTANFTVAGGTTLVLSGSLPGTGGGGSAWPAATVTGAGTVNLPLGKYANVGLDLDMGNFTGILDLTNGMMCASTYYSPSFVWPTNGTIKVENNTTLYLGWGASSYTTTVELAGGIDNGENLGVLRGDGTTSLNGGLMLAANSTIGSAGGTLTINGVISDGGNGFGFTEVASGTVVLNGPNTYTGPTVVSAGTVLQCNHTNALGHSTLSINTGGKVNLTFTGSQSLAALTLGGVPQTGGTYGSSASGATHTNDTFFSGTGVVRPPPSTLDNMLTFSFGALGSAAIIGNTINMLVPGGTDVTHLAPTYTVSPGATGSPVSGTTENFSSPVTYTVTAEDGVTTQQYVVTVSQGVLANLFTWTNTASGKWSVAANWTNDVGNQQTPLGGGRSSYTLNFTTAGTYSATNDLNAGFLLNQLNFGGPTLTLWGNGLAFTANGATLPQISQNSGATCTISNALNLATNITLGGGGAGQVALVGALSGPGMLTKTNSGQLTFTGPPSHTGGTHVLTGTLYLNAAATGFAPGAAAFTMANVTVESGATLEGFRAHIVGGTLTLNGGRYFEYNGYNDAKWDGPIVLAANSYFGRPNTYNYGQTVRGQISGPGGFQWDNYQGGIKLTLTASNSYAGTTMVTSGTLVCSNINALGSGGPLNITSLNGREGMVELDYTGTHFISGLTIDGTVVPPGTYGSTTSTAPPANQDGTHFAGVGTVTVPGPADIIAFAVPGATSVTIDPVLMTISVVMPARTDLTKIAPTYTLFSGTCVPASGSTNNFSNPVIYTVTDGATINAYTVRVTVPASYYWQGPSGGNWSAAANWDNTVPATGNVAIFSDSASAGAIVNLDTDVTVSGLIFNNLVTNQTIASTSGNTLELSSIVLQGGTLSITCPINATASVLTESGAGTLNIGGALTTAVAPAWGVPIVNGAVGIVLSGTGSWTDTSGSYLDVGSVSGTGVLTINDSATLDWSATSGLCVGFFNTGESGKVVQNGGTVKTPPVATAWWNNNGPGVMLGDYSSGATTAEYDLNGGTLITPNIYNIYENSKNILQTPPGSVIFRFNGGVLRGTQNDNLGNADVVAEGTTNLMGNLTHAYVGLGGANIDVAAFGCGINQALEHDPALGATPDGGLHAMSTGGPGTLALYKLGTFTGPLAIDTGVTVNLGYAGNQRVASVTIGTGNQGAGTFGVGHSNPNGVFTGTGTVTVLPPPSAPALPTASFSRPGGVPTFTGIATLSGYTYYLVWKNNLTDTNWTPITPGTVGTGSPMTFTDSSPNPQHRFYRIEAE